jgi:Glycosyl hydrolase catalytic core
MLFGLPYVLRRGAAGALICAAAVAACLLSAAPAAPAATTARLAGTPSYFFGSTPSLNTATLGPLSQAYARLKAGGATWVRFRVSWAAVEWNEGKYYWPLADKFFTASACTGLDPLPTFMDSPRWASGLDTGLAPPQPSRYPAWRAFIRAAVGRYGVGGGFWKGQHYCADGVTPVPAAPARVWKIWNEPNVSVFWGGRTPSAGEYAQLLAAADQAIDNSINPDAPIVMGGLPNDAEGYLKALYTAMPALNTHFEVFDLQPYAGTVQRVLTKLQGFRSVANQHGASAKPIWVTEVGWSSCLESGWSYPASCANSSMAADEAGQATNLTDLYTLLAGQASSLRLERVAWYGWHDPPLGPQTCGACYGAGLFHRDGSAKPSWRAYVALAGGRPS